MGWLNFTLPVVSLKVAVEPATVSTAPAAVMRRMRWLLVSAM